MIKVDITFTSSKVAAFIIIIGGLVYGMLYQESTVVISAFTIGGGILGVKQYNDMRKETVKGTLPIEDSY